MVDDLHRPENQGTVFSLGNTTPGFTGTGPPTVVSSASIRPANRLRPHRSLLFERESDIFS